MSPPDRAFSTPSTAWARAPPTTTTTAGPTCTSPTSDRTSLYHNNGGRTFTDATRTAGVGSQSFGASCAFADVDRDGDVDLFVANYVDARIDNNIFCGDTASRLRIYCHPLNFAPLPSVLYRNNGNGTFTDVSQPAGNRGASRQRSRRRLRRLRR